MGRSAAVRLAVVEFLTVAEVATLARVSKMTVYRLVKTGEIEGAIRVGRSFRVPAGAVAAYLGLEPEPAGG